MSETLADLAELVGGEVVGDPARTIAQVRTLEEATAADLSFLTHARYAEAAKDSDAGVLLVGEELRSRVSDLGKELLVCVDPQLALAGILERLADIAPPTAGTHPTAVVDGSASVAESAAIGPFVVVEAGATIGAGADVGAHGVVGAGATIGAGTLLHPRVTIYPRSVIGRDCILHSGVVIGADGYGYATSGGTHHKLVHLGRVVVGDEVEVGANSTIDRGLLGDTSIGDGTKIDDLVMVAHNVKVGRGCLLVAQAGIAGSARLGDYVTVAGQSGIIGHVEIGDGVVVAAKSAVFQEVEKGRQVGGIPAVELPSWRRQQAMIRQLGEWRSRLRRIERSVASDEETEA